MDTYGIFCVFVFISIISVVDLCPEIDNLPDRLSVNTEGPYGDHQIVSFECNVTDNKQLVGESYAVCTNGQLYFSQFPSCQDGCVQSTCAGKHGYCNDMGHCVCRPGYSYVSDYQNCSKKTSVKTTITFKTNWRDDYSNKSSNSFKTIQADICYSFDKAFQKNDTIGNSSILCYVASFEESANDDEILAFVINDFFEEASVTSTKVQTRINDAAKSGNCFRLPGMEYNLTNDAVSSDLDECDEKSHICAGDFAICRYTTGGNYECDCAPGTYKTDNYTVDGSDCDAESMKLGLVVGLGLACGIALGCFLPAYLWFLISPAFEKHDFNAANYEESMKDEEDSEDDNHQDDASFEDDELDKHLTLHEEVIKNMTNFNPMPVVNYTNQARGFPNSIELSADNQMGNLYNQPSNVYYSR